MTNQNENIIEFLKNNSVLIVGVVVALAAVPALGHYWMQHRALVSAEAQLTKGFPAVAADVVENYREGFVSSARGCQVLISSYAGTRDIGKLEWAGQACLSKGQDIPETYLGLAAAREMTGRDTEAFQLLAAVAQKFDKVPDIYLRMGQILQRNKQPKDALAAFLKASERAPQNNQLTLETIIFGTTLQAWNEIRPLAERIKTTQTTNPEVKLLLARVFKQVGDTASEQAVVQQAKDLLAKSQNRAEIEKAFADVLKNEGPTVASNAHSHGKTKQ